MTTADLDAPGRGRSAPSAVTTAAAAERSPLRSVAMPSEHGGWGLTLEPVLLGLLVTYSIGGLTLGLAAFAAFLVRTPLKLALVDRRRGRDLERTALARRVAASELAIIAVLVAITVTTSGLSWLVPVAFAVPLVGVELWYDVRSRGRRLIPEVCGAVGMAAVASAIVIAGSGSTTIAVGLWLVLAARAVASIVFVRARIVHFRRGASPSWPSDLAQVAAVAVVAGAVGLDRGFLLGALAVTGVAIAQIVGVRRPPVAARRIGFRQLGIGLAVVAATALGLTLA